jgi:hypothetical protein
MTNDERRRVATKRQRDVLEAAEHMFRVLDGAALLTGRSIRAAVARQCVSRGWLVDSGPVLVLDGDGCALDPERYRHGYMLTDAGRAALAADEIEAGR